MNMIRKTILATVILAAMIAPSAATIDYVNLQDLDSTYSTGEEVSLVASVRGSDIQELRIQRSTDNGFSWTTLKSIDCLSRDECSSSTEDTRNSEGTVKYRTKALSDTETATDVQETEFVHSSGEIDSVTLDVSDTSVYTGDSVDLDASASGSDIETLRIQKSTDGGFSWTTLKSIDCLERSSCDTSDSYSQDSEGDVKVRARAVTDSDAKNDVRTVTFDERTASDRIDDVDVSVSSDRVKFGERIRIDADADGAELQELRIQKSTDKFAWRTLKSIDCLERSSCDTYTRHTHSSGDDTVYYRARIVTDNHAENDVRKVNYYEEEEQKYKPSIDLRQPYNGETGVSRNPLYKWKITDQDDSEMEDVTLYVEDSYGSGDVPWNQPDYKYNVADTVGDIEDYSSTTTWLKPGNEYVWGIKADDGDHVVRSEVYHFTTRDDDDTDTDGSLRVTVRDGDNDRLENAYVRIKNGDYRTDRTNDDGVSKFNDLESGWYNIRVKCDGEVEDRRVHIAEGEDERKTVKMDRKSSDNYCDDDDESDEPRASFTVSDTNPEVDEEVRFDASGSEGNIMEYRWSFPDGTTEYGEVVYRSFDSPGEKEIDLRITEYDYDQDSTTRTIDVQEREDDEDTGSLEVTVRDDDGDRLENAHVRIRNGDYRTDRTDNDGESFFGDLEPDRYDIRVRCEGEEENDNIRVSENEDETITIRMDFDSSDNYCDRDDDDDEDPRARLDVSPSVADIGEEVEFDATDSSDDGDIEEYEFDLDGDGDYDVTTDDGRIERRFFDEFDGYARVRVTDDDGNRDTARDYYEVRSGRRVSLSDLDMPNRVCDGESFDADFEVRNIGDDERFIVVEGRGFGDRVSSVTTLDEDEREDMTLTFTAGDAGTRTVRISSYNSNTLRRTIEVLDCDERDDGDVSDISVEVTPDRVNAGESIKISGYVEDTRGRQSVRVLLEGRLIADTMTQPDGYYQVYAYPDRVGRSNIVASSDGETARTSVEVLPTVRMSSLDIPDNIFQGEEFEICGRVESQVEALVILRRNGERIDSQYGRGEVCFDETNKNAGEVQYSMGAYARQSGDSISRQVEILETKPETSSFPGQIASVESGDGIVKATIYNSHKEQRRYDVEISDLPSTWVSTSEKQVILQPGEQREVFFYLTPQREGRYTPEIKIRSQGTTIYEETVDVITGGTSEPRKKSFFQGLKDALLWW